MVDVAVGGRMEGWMDVQGYYFIAEETSCMMFDGDV